MASSKNGSKNTENSSSTIKILIKEWLAAGIANAITSGFLNPMDVTKTRLQTYPINHPAHGSLYHTFIILYQEGGLIGIWKPGLQASVIREMLNSGARAGFYSSVKREVYKLWNIVEGGGTKESDINHNPNHDFIPKVLAAMITGMIGATIANPIDVIKIRLMNNPTMYSSTLSAFHTILQTEGVVGLYKGFAPSVLRGSFISAGELATYDHSKTILKSYGKFEEGSSLHICSSLITGLVATTVAAPFDTLKTRAMNSTGARGMGMGQLFISIISTEGVVTLFRGWVPSYCRLGPHALICFPIYEQIRRLAGLEYF